MLSDAAIDAVTKAVFAKPLPWVAEAYSAYDQKPLQFQSSVELKGYVQDVLAKPRGHAFLFVVYPDMGGRAVRKTIHLKPRSVPDHELRYTWEGWGLISVQLTHEERPVGSWISANSESRARKWAATCPEWESPMTWNWAAVTSHTRRLQRVLKQYV